VLAATAAKKVEESQKKVVSVPEVQQKAPEKPKPQPQQSSPPMHIEMPESLP